MKDAPLIISTFLDDDGRISGTRSEPLLKRAGGLGLTAAELMIQPLSAGWDAEPPGTFKSGAGPIFALAEAKRLLGTGTDLVVVRGKEELRTAYTSEERGRLMDVFSGTPLPQAYTELAQEFMHLHGISEEMFKELARALEANCRKTALERGLKVPNLGKNDGFITRLFRLADCANPVCDFEGEVVLATPEAAIRLGMTGVRVAAVEISEIPDGPENVEKLAKYEHLRSVFQRVSKSTGLSNLFSGIDDVALELYTCFPVVPLAYLWAVGWAQSPAEMLEFLKHHPITLSGGMNFARAPWNNPALRGVILAARAVENGARVGLVHGNGGLGGRQGVCAIIA
jgi:hypothetical protein